MAAMHPLEGDYEIAELAFDPGARVNRFEEKAAFVRSPTSTAYATPGNAAECDRSPTSSI